jgi:hypothetical protein
MKVDAPKNSETAVFSSNFSLNSDPALTTIPRGTVTGDEQNSDVR